MKTKTLALLLAVLTVLTFSACSGNTDTPSTSATPSTPGTPEQSGAAVEGLKEPIAEMPVLLTSVGQSADVEMVKVMMEKAEIAVTLKGLASGADVSEFKTLVLAVGGSSKGLGAAGIDADQEIARVKELIDAADQAGLTIVAVHIGGEARRGELSDKFIAPSFEKADYAIVVADGDKDGLMAGLASAKGIPMDVVSTIADAVTPLGAAFIK